MDKNLKARLAEGLIGGGGALVGVSIFNYFAWPSSRSYLSWFSPLGIILGATLLAVAILMRRALKGKQTF
jgi:hypothetical protein